MIKEPSILNPLDLTGRHYLVTGASSGIGRSTALLLHTLGARLALVDRDQGGLDTLHEALGFDETVNSYVVDLSDPSLIDELVLRCVGNGGPLHGVVHCAGIQSIGPVRSLRMEVWRKIFAVNTEAALALSKSMSSKKVYAGEHG